MSERAPGENPPDRLYVLTGGRTEPATTRLELITIIVARSAPQLGDPPEWRRILNLCSSPMSVAELGAYLKWPVGPVAVLVEDLLKKQRVEARAPGPTAVLPDAALIQEVMDGLRAKL